MHRLALTFVVAVLVVAALAVAHPLPASAAIPCEAQPELVAASVQAPIARQSDIPIEDILAGNDPAASTPSAASPVAGQDWSAQGAIENIVRCLGYNDIGAFGTLLTPEYRAFRLGVVTADDARGVVRQVDSIRLLRSGETAVDGDGRFHATAELLINGEFVLLVTLGFVQVDGLPYLDDSRAERRADVTASVRISLNDTAVEPPALEIAASGVTRVTIDHNGDVPAGYVLTDASGASVREGRVDPDSFAGPPDDSVLALYDLAPGTYGLSFAPRGNPLQSPLEVVITVDP